MRNSVGGVSRKSTKGFDASGRKELLTPLAMAGNNRMSMYSTTSSGPGLPRNVNSTAQHSTQVSTTTLLNAIHTIYTSSQPFHLETSTSLCIDSWLTASQPDQEGRTGGTVDGALSARAWEHARRRAEDGCIVLGYEFPPLPRLGDFSHII